jgi:hypothetical protein
LLLLLLLRVHCFDAQLLLLLRALAGMQMLLRLLCCWKQHA